MSNECHSACTDGCDRGMMIFSGNSNPELAAKIAKSLGLSLGKVQIDEKSDGEKVVTIEDCVRGCDVYVIQPTSAPIGENLLELIILIDALKRASARMVTAVIPYYGYARQDRKQKPRDPITAKLLANVITVAGARHLLVVDLHAKQVQGFFDVPVDHIHCMPLFADYFSNLLKGEDVVVVSPDAGGVSRARDIAQRLGTAMAIVYEKKHSYDVVGDVNVIGDVKGKVAIIVDDIIDTGDSVTIAANKVIERGAREVYACATHAVLSGDATAKLEASPIKQVVVTDTVWVPEEKKIEKLHILSAAELIAEAIRRLHEELPLGAMPNSMRQ